MPHFTLSLLFGLVLALGGFAAHAIDVFEEPGSAIPHEFIEPPAWKEEGGGAIDLPAFPDMNALLEFAVDDPSGSFVYAIDPEALSIGGDGVVRYTVVLRSRTGARNVFFEGIRCQTLQYRTYAHGLPEDRFQPMRDSAWRDINLNDRGSGRYRYELLNDYLCDRTHQPLSHHEILRRLKLPAHAQPNRFNIDLR